MKRFTTFLMTLLLFTLGASAQTDYTWALGNGTWAGNSGTYGAGVEVYKTTAFGSGKVLYATVTGLPAGEYTLTFYAVASSTSSRDAITNDAYGSGIAQVFATAGGTTQTTDVTVIQQIACEPSDYPYTFTVNVGEDGTLEYGLQNIATGGNWYVCQGVSLTFSGEATTRELEPGDVVEEEPGDESSLSHYSLTYTGSGSNGGLDYNTWSGESGMTTPYHQVWVLSTTGTLSDMTISHYEIPLLPAGTYTVTVDARVLSEADNAFNEKSAFFCANDASVDIVAEATTNEEFNYNGTNEREANGTYTLTATVGDDGILNIYFTIKDATYNWISWKNLSVTFKEAAAEEEEPGAEEPEPYKFVCTDWVTMDTGRVYQDDISYDESANTVTVTPRTDTYGGLNNVALGNSADNAITTANYYITAEQKYFTVVGTDLHTEAEDNTYSQLWWMNGVGGPTAKPDYVVELTATGEVLFAWDLTTISDYSSVLIPDADGKIYLTGWTGFGLTTTGTSSTISDINFYTEEELQAIIASDEEPGTEDPEPEVEPEYVYEEVYSCVAEESHWTSTGVGIGYNTWSVEADASGMVTPFLQLWSDSGVEQLAASTVSHNQLTGLEPGTYEVSLDIRIFSEVGNEIGEGTTFNANEASVDLLTEGTEGTYSTNDHPSMTEVYGTYVLTCTVDDAGTLDISLVVPEDATYNWIAWKNLKVAEKTSTADIELVAVEGVMNAEVQAAMEDAIAAFDASLKADDYYTALAAIEAAEASVEYYAPIVEVVDALDEAGAAVWAESEYAAMLEARTLTNEDVNADLAAAQKAQTTEGSDMTYAVIYDGDWTGNTGTYQTGVERYGDEIEVEDETVKVLYKTLEGLTPGTYTVTFYAVANNAWVGAAVGDGIAQVFANETAVDVTVYDQTSCTITDYPHTITCTVGVDGVLEFGLQNIATGGNWYVAEAISLTLVEALDSDLADLIIRYNDDCTAAEECEAALADMIENGDKTDETIASMAEALEALEAVMAQYGNIDTSDTSAIDVDELTSACEAIEAALDEAQDVYTTGLQSVTVATEDDAIYKLSGVRVSKAVKGVYIVNGKKVLVK